ncbi:LPXTG cell wall anchor domain-containing protein [Glycomyces terrestris]|uniref:LPXTG cell wall anchor domain-containing protein n=1 Tax=Glycomyces terrestris TaxID=2493553 RepID=UPI0013158390|nr:LPXTG cell wall anchor domain-containing protein [Glycomyces terrestris]
MEFKQPFSSLRLAAAAGVVGALAFAAPAHAEVVTIPINPGNVPTTAADHEDQSCDNLPDDLGENVDGWVFVLPASAGAEGNFLYIIAEFEDENGDTVYYDTDADGGIVSGSGDNKAYIITPAGLTLVGAEAEVNDPDEGADFNLTHACAGTPGEEPSSPGEEPSSPSEEPTSPGEETPSGEESTTPGTTLPTTGTPLTIALVSAAALAAGGAALFMIMRRRREAQDW